MHYRERGGWMGDHVVGPVRVAGRYRLLEPVGSGGMGRVWLARDEMLHRDVAVKEVVPPNWLTESERDELRHRTLREARATARLNHPNVVKIYDVVHTEAWPWIVMEYVSSRSLHEVIKQDGPLSPRRTAEIGLAVLAGLRAAHRAGVLHRDVKPHNVLIDTDGRVVLTDFGLATFEGDGAITRAGLVMGSPHYVAPERAAQGISTVETDLWSLGATLFAAVEGHSPFARPSTMATLTALATEPPDPVRRAGPLAPVLTGLLRKDPRQRLAVAEVDRQLRRVVDGDVGARPRLLPRPRRSPENTDVAPPVAGAARPPPEASGRWRRRRWWLPAGSAAIVALVILSAALLAQDRPSADPASSGSPPTGSASESANPARAAAPGVRACDAPPAGERTLTPLPGASTAVDGRALPGGFSWHRDPAGFRLAVPDGWTYFRAGDIVCFADPEGDRSIGVDPHRPATGDPVGDAEREERRLLDAGALPGYERISLEPTPFVAGADWEFTFNAGGPRHAASRSYPASGDRAYAVFGVTREFDWTTNRSVLDLVKTSFRADR